MASNDKTIRIILKLKDEMSRDLDKAAGKLDKLGKSMKSVGKSMTIGLTLPIVGAGVAMFKAFADFENIMAELEARTGSTADEMEMMGKVAKQMGRDTVFSATQAAQAMLELTSSGSTAAEAMEQLPAVLNLAAAGALDLQVAADGVTDVLAQFQLEAKDSVMVTNELAKAAGSSSATVSALLQGFANGAVVAKQFGFSVNETAATLAVLAENGIKGAQAGTALKSMLTNMTRQTEKTQGAWAKLGISMFDSAGNMRDFNTVIQEVKVAMEKLSMEEQIELTDALAGSYGKTALNSLLASDGIEAMQESMKSAASAGEVAEARMNTLSGRFTSLMGSVETLGITLGGLGEGPITDFIKMLTDVVNAVTLWAEENPALAQTLMLVVGAIAAMGPILWIIGTAITLFGTLTTVIGFLAPAFALLTGPIGVVIAALVALKVAFDNNFLGIRDLVEGFVGFMMDAWAIITGQQFAMEADHPVLRFLGDIRNRVETAVEGMFGLGRLLIEGLIKGVLSMVGDLLKLMWELASGITKTIQSAFGIKSPSKVMAKLGEQVVAGFHEGIGSMGGIGVTVPGDSGSSSGATIGGGIGGGVFINNLNVPPGTSREQVDEIMRQIGKRALRNGAKSFG